jgi:DNA-binding response OmpR family regulator
MRILIAEDDRVTRLMLAKMIEVQGHDVVQATDGAEAWELFQRHETRLIITDWLMPNVDGLKLCQMVRAQRHARYVYIMVLTSLERKQNYLEAMDAGADDFLNKPVDVAELKARLRVAERILALQGEVDLLEGLLPICMYCKKIRDDDESWHQLEQYVEDRSEVEFSHGVCPNCYELHMKPHIDAAGGPGSRGKG